MVARIPVDLYNPGHVFASLGVVEALQALDGIDATSRFVADAGGTAGTFEIECDVDDPVARVIDFLRAAEVVSVLPRPDGTVRLDTKKWDVPSLSATAETFEIPVPRSPATLPALLRTNDGREITLDSWGDDRSTGRDNVKFWAGSGGYPGAGLARDAVELLADVGDDAWHGVARDPFALTAPMSSSFRFDWRRDYIPLDAGFSPNAHAGMTMVGYPLVELLAAVGLENARPSRVRSNDKLHYRYATWHDALPPSLARAALGAVDLGFSCRIFDMTLGWPGQPNQARCIVSVREVSR